jgi:hypothetical protein
MLPPGRHGDGAGRCACARSRPRGSRPSPTTSAFPSVAGVIFQTHGQPSPYAGSCHESRRSEPGGVDPNGGLPASLASVDGTTDGRGVGRRRTTVDDSACCAHAPNSRRTDVAAGERRGPCRDHLQNRWAASLAMSPNGSFPSRPRHFLLGKWCRKRPSLLTAVMIASEWAFRRHN